MNYLIFALFTTLISNAAPPAPGLEIVATVNGEPITGEALEEAIKAQREAIEQQLEALRRTVLFKLIDNRLVEQAARAAGLSLEAYLQASVEQVTVTDAEVEEAYQRSRWRFPGALAPEAKYRIRRELEDNRRADALRRLLERLRRGAHVTNLPAGGRSGGCGV